MNLALLLLLAGPASAAPPSLPAAQAPVATLAQALPASYEVPRSAPADPLSALIVAAAEPQNSPQRRAARSRLFHEVYPQLMAAGMPASGEDAAGIARACLSLTCTAGTPRVDRALVQGDLAFVAAAGMGGGGCTYLLRRDGDSWVELMPLSWTLHP